MNRAFLRDPSEPPFRLLETMRYTPAAGYDLLAEHLDRLLASARHFGFEVDVAKVRETLRVRAEAMPVESRVRLLVDLDGGIDVESEPLSAAASRPVRVGFAAIPIDPQSPWLYHKTTRREVYEAALRARPDCDDVLLWNPRGELTEATRWNVAVEIDGHCYTPPVACGLLPGTLRGRLLAEGRFTERVLRVDEVRGRRLFLLNSVRGWREAVLVEAEAAALPDRPRPA